MSDQHSLECGGVTIWKQYSIGSGILKDLKLKHLCSLQI